MERCFVLSGEKEILWILKNLYIARKIYDPLLLSSSFKAYSMLTLKRFLFKGTPQLLVMQNEFHYR